MRTVIVSDNPLFAEVVSETVAGYPCELVTFKAGESLAGLCQLQPDLVILDETMQEMAAGQLATVCHLVDCRILLVNLCNNDLVILDAEKRTVTNIDHLKEAMMLETTS